MTALRATRTILLTLAAGLAISIADPATAQPGGTLGPATSATPAETIKALRAETRQLREEAKQLRAMAQLDAAIRQRDKARQARDAARAAAEKARVK